MAEKQLRSGSAVYAADGTYLGRLLQCDHSCMVIAQSWWRLDFYVVPHAEVATAGRNTLILRCLANDLRPETARSWSPPPDPVGNANGADLEPLRAGMAEIDGMHASKIPASPLSAPMTTTRPDPPLPSPEDIDSLDRERIARIDAQIDRYIAAGLEDLQIAASCATPPGYQHVANYEIAFTLGDTRPPPRRPVAGFSVPTRDRSARVQGAVAPAARALSSVGDEAARSPKALGQALCRAGFSPVEAETIVAGGYAALAALRSACPLVVAAG